MNIKTFPNTFVGSNKRINSILVSLLQPTLLLFLLWFPLSYIRQFLHEAGHALVNLLSYRTLPLRHLHNLLSLGL